MNELVQFGQNFDLKLRQDKNISYKPASMSR